jgi:hypothetical protein
MLQGEEHVMLCVCATHLSGFHFIHLQHQVKGIVGCTHAAAQHTAADGRVFELEVGMPAAIYTPTPMAPTVLPEATATTLIMLGIEGCLSTPVAIKPLPTS